MDLLTLVRYPPVRLLMDRVLGNAHRWNATHLPFPVAFESRGQSHLRLEE